MTISVHLCRGNFKSAWVAQGGYEPVAEILLNEMKIDGFFLEYDDERSGDFAPLRFAPKGKTIVLGLMSSKHAAAETQGRGEAPHRRGLEICAARAMRAQPPVRVLLHRARQRPHRGRPMEEARTLRRRSHARCGATLEAGTPRPMKASPNVRWEERRNRPPLSNPQASDGTDDALLEDDVAV